jgi:hypothetical protein
MLIIILADGEMRRACSNEEIGEQIKSVTML